MTNSDICSLSILEAELRGIKYSKSFTHKFVAPLYTVSEKEWSKIVYIITLLSMCISMYYLINFIFFEAKDE